MITPDKKRLVLGNISFQKMVYPVLLIVYWWTEIGTISPSRAKSWLLQSGV